MNRHLYLADCASFRVDGSPLKRFADQRFSDFLDTLQGVLYSKEELDDIRGGTLDHKKYLTVGRDLADDGQYLPAIRVLRRCLEVAPGTIFAYLIMARCYYHLKDEGKTQILVLNAFLLYKSYEDRKLSSARGEDRDSASLDTRLAQWLMARAIGTTPEELQQKPLVDWFLQDDFLPTPTSLSRSKESSPIFYYMGVMCLEAPSLAEAEICFRMALKESPTDWRSSANLGAALVRQGHPSDAVAALVSGLEVNPRDEVALLNLASTFALLEFPGFARACAQRALHLRPGYDQAKRLLESLTSVSWELVPLREKAGLEIWGPARLAALAIDSDARLGIRTAERMLSSSGKEEATASSSVVRAYAAGIEREAASFLTPLLSPPLPQRPLTLGTAVRLIAQNATDLCLEKDATLNSAQPPLVDELKAQHRMSDSEIQQLANALYTLTPIRNAVAHGGAAGPRDAENCRALAKACLLLFTQARVQRICDAPVLLGLFIRSGPRIETRYAVRDRATTQNGG